MINNSPSYYDLVDSPNIYEYLEHIKKENIREPVYRLELVQKTDETPYAVIEDYIINSSGSLTISLNEGVRRTCSFTITNIENEFTQMFSYLSIGSKFKLYLGEMVKGKPCYFAQGVFVFDNPALLSGVSQKEISISGTDKWSMLDGTNGGILQTPYKIVKGSTFKQIITDTIALDICGDLIPPIIDDRIANFQTSYDIEKESGSAISEMILEVALNANAYVYYDINGQFVAKPVEYDEVKASEYDFVAGQDINYIQSTKTLDYLGVFNGTFVEADNVQDENIPITAFATNNDLTDPNSVPNLGYIKWKQITDYTTGISTQQKAQERVNYELKKVASLSSALSIECRPLYYLIENNIITLTDPYVGCEQERFLVSEISMPISYDGTMSISASKAMGYI